MKTYAKKNFDVSQIRRFLEPGPIVMLSSRWKDETDIMTMGWHAVMEFTPSLIGCIISNQNYSFDLVRKSKECVINIPELHLAHKVVGVGNTTGAEIDKFAEFGFTPQAASKVSAPLIKECYANFECKLVDARLVSKYNFFIFKCVKAHVAIAPKYPKTIHYRGDGQFMVSGSNLNLRREFKPSML